MPGAVALMSERPMAANKYIAAMGRSYIVGNNKRQIQYAFESPNTNATVLKIILISIHNDQWRM